MKQLSIFCSSDLADLVRDALVEAGVEGYVMIPHAVGSRPGATWEHGRYPQWETDVFMTPVEEAQAEAVVEALREHCGKCDPEPCLKILVSSLDAVH